MWDLDKAGVAPNSFGFERLPHARRCSSLRARAHLPVPSCLLLTLEYDPKVRAPCLVSTRVLLYRFSNVSQVRLNHFYVVRRQSSTYEMQPCIHPRTTRVTAAMVPRSVDNHADTQPVPHLSRCQRATCHQPIRVVYSRISHC